MSDDLGWMESNEELRDLCTEKKNRPSALVIQGMVKPGQTWATQDGNLVIGAVFNHGVSASLDGKITDFEDLVHMLQHECGAALDLQVYHYAEDFALIDHIRKEWEGEHNLGLWYRDRWITEDVCDELKLDPHELPLVRWERQTDG